MQLRNPSFDEARLCAVYRKAEVMAPRSDEFGRLLKAGISSIAHCEGKTAPAVEEWLGSQIGVTGFTIQRYKSGSIPAEPRTVRLLAEACVQRGFLNRTWLEHFLAAARYHHPEALMSQLFPAIAAAGGGSRANLPAPTYSKFVMRAQAYADVVEGLGQRTPVVLITSLGGMGKTSLAREIAAQCMVADGEGPYFDTVVWLSDKDRPGTTNLSLLLDEIARTLDYPGLLQLAYDEKRLAVEQLLRHRCALLVIDNYETITDGALDSWLLRVPEPTKVLITTRKAPAMFRASWLVDLGGMTEDEALALINYRLRALKLGPTAPDAILLAPLLAAAGGNPKAIELALGLMKYEHWHIRQASDELYAARGELFDDLFARSWALLDEPARRILMVLPFCAEGADATALSAIAEVPASACTRAIALLDDLALLDRQQAHLEQPPRFTQHPLVRAFALARLAEAPAFELAARQQWLRWYGELANKVGFCWNDLSRLELLDSEHGNLHQAIEWAFSHQHYAETIALIEGVRYYYNVRGLWDNRLTINRMRVESARQLGDSANEALGLAFDIEIYSKQSLLELAAGLIERLNALADDPTFSADVQFEIGHAQALYARACGDNTSAEQIWRRMLGLSATLAAQKYIVNRRWLAISRYQQGDIDESLQLFHASLADARTSGDIRSVLGNTLKIASIALDQGDTNAASAALAECRAGAEQLRDRRRLSELHWLLARLHLLQGDTTMARTNLLAAIDLFNRLGMRRELAEAQAALDNLDNPRS